MKIDKLTLDILHPFPGLQTVTADVPPGTKLLHVHEQHGSPCLWAAVPEARPEHLVPVDILVVESGHSPECELGVYLGAIHLAGGSLVLHCFDITEQRIGQLASAGDLRDPLTPMLPDQGSPGRKHGHYYKTFPTNLVDVYRVLLTFRIDDPCIQHAVKKLLVAGGRGGGKDQHQDIQETIDTLQRWQEMRGEEDAR